jgi:hypothetical protein
MSGDNRTAWRLFRSLSPAGRSQSGTKVHAPVPFVDQPSSKKMEISQAAKNG